jgi:hypothetical protein
MSQNCQKMTHGSPNFVNMRVGGENRGCFNLLKIKENKKNKGMDLYLAWF